MIAFSLPSASQVSSTPTSLLAGSGRKLDCLRLYITSSHQHSKGGGSEDGGRLIKFRFNFRGDSVAARIFRARERWSLRQYWRCWPRWRTIVATSCSGESSEHGLSDREGRKEDHCARAGIQSSNGSNFNRYRTVYRGSYCYGLCCVLQTK